MVTVMKNNQRENKMTTVETMQLIGKQGTIFVGGLNVDVTVKDIKQGNYILNFLVRTKDFKCN
jgi:hypothetical protein